MVIIAAATAGFYSHAFPSLSEAASWLIMRERFGVGKGDPF